MTYGGNMNLKVLDESFKRYTNNPDAARLILRLTFGGLMLFHGIAKAKHGLAPIMALLESHHLPAFVAWGAYIGEIIAPLMLILGVMTRYAAAIFTFTMLLATWLVMDGKVFALTSQGAWALELQAVYLCGGFSMLFLGGGKYTVLSELSSRR
jgi:putative oxidoreductase